MSAMMVIDGAQLARYQLCRRRWLLEREWQFLKWHPKALFDSCLRDGAYRLSTGTTPETVISDATTRYLSAAANPGLDLLPGADPYQIAGDWCATLSTVLTAMSRLTLLSLSRVQPILMQSSQSWLPLSFADESGTLHRWITVDSWDADAQARAVHSWLTVGDMAVLDAPMTLHVVEVGSMRNGRRISPWCRAFRHPVIAGRLRFQRPDGKGGWRSLHGDQWEAAWLADLHAYSPEQWVDLMTKDGIISKILHHSAISPLREESRRLVLGQILAEAQAMRELQTGGNKWERIPMNRGACDGWRPCPHQGACYVPAGSAPDLGASGLYQLRPAALPSSGSMIHQAVASV